MFLILWKSCLLDWAGWGKRSLTAPATKHNAGGVVYYVFMFIGPIPVPELGFEWLTQRGMVYYFSSLQVQVQSLFLYGPLKLRYTFSFCRVRPATREAA